MSKLDETAKLGRELKSAVSESLFVRIRKVLTILKNRIQRCLFWNTIMVGEGSQRKVPTIPIKKRTSNSNRNGSKHDKSISSRIFSQILDEKAQLGSENPKRHCDSSATEKRKECFPWLSMRMMKDGVREYFTWWRRAEFDGTMKGLTFFSSSFADWIFLVILGEAEGPRIYPAECNTARAFDLCVWRSPSCGMVQRWCADSESR